MASRKSPALIALLAVAASASTARASEVVLRFERARDLSELLLAADGKLVEKQPIAALHASVLAGHGAWKDLDARTLAASVRALAKEKTLALRVEANATSRASGECCGVEVPADPEAARLQAAKLAWPRRALGLEGRDDDARGTLVAVLDTGVDEEHPLLAGALLRGESLVEGEQDLVDRNGHGTAMAGALVAHGEGPFAPRGIARGAKVLSIKVLDARGDGDLATLARGIVRAADRNARVILVSAGLATPSALLEEAVRYARSRGALVVAAAGNEPLGRALSPAATPGALGVTATCEPGKLALAYALDPAIELAAPGANVLTVLPRSIAGGMGLVSGTSVSAALAAGTAALVLGRGASAEEALRVLRGARRPLLATEERFLPVGELDAALALERLDSADVALEALWSVPAFAAPGAKVTLHARVRSVGGKLAANLPADGSGLEVESVVTVPEGGRVTFACAGHERALQIPRGESAPRIVVTKLVLDGSTLVASLANEGDRAARALVVRAAAEDRATGGSTAVPGVELRAVTLESLEPGARAEVRFEVPELGREVVRFSVIAGATRGFLDARLDGADPRPVRPQYQQSDSVDLIADAPWRLEPNRSYVPVLVFVPSKGDAGRAVDLALDTALIRALDSPTATTGTTLYKYETGVNVAADPTRFAAGTDILDEDGQPLGSLNLFQDQVLAENGRHEIFRFPRAAFGVAAQPAQTVRKFIEVRLHFKAHRKTAQGALVLDQGDYRKVLQVVFSAKPLPRFAGLGRYYDTHVHTIAEWYFDAKPGFDPLAPRKSYGGPLVMLREAAYALGFTDRAIPAPGSIITTDHSCFFNEEDPDANDGLRRPQVGPSAPGNSLDAQGKVKDQLTRYREIFGITGNEEVAVAQSQKIMGLPLPWGAHMLAFRSGHWESRWNAIDGGTSPNVRKFGRGKLPLDEVLATLAQNAAQENKDAFLYTAHALAGSLPWDKQNLDTGLDGKWTNAVSGRFVLKGHQLWNRRPARDVPGSRIDWRNLNPFADQDWQKGHEGWSHALETSLLAYHEQVAQLLRFERASEPGRVFPRKLYLAAGSDAHGDFNYEENRLATFLNLPPTFTLSDNAYGRARVYVFEDGFPGSADGERSMNALSYGSACVTDGPLASLAFDADGRLDSTKLAFHMRRSSFEDEDGKMGGAGAGPDGGRTALVVAGSTDALYGYRYEDAPEVAVSALELYRDEAGTKPLTRTLYDADKKASYAAAAPLGALPLGAAGQRNVAPAHPVTALSALQLGVFAGAKAGAGGPETGRCYTNPVWVAPVLVELLSVAPDVARGALPAGALRIRFTFPLSMEPRAYALEVKPLDANGDSTDGTVPGLALSGTWSAANGVKDSVLEVTNATDIPLAQPSFPRAGRATFVVIFKDAPRDSFGNELNRIAATFETPSTASTASAGRTAPASTSAMAGAPHGGAGCELSAGSPGSAAALLPLVFVLAVVYEARRQGFAHAARRAM